MNKKTQPRLFDEQDLPLFSGTPIGGKVERFDPGKLIQATQQTIGYEMPTTITVREVRYDGNS